MKTLLILNDPPYGTERSRNGLRLVGSLARRDGSSSVVAPQPQPSTRSEPVT